MTPGRSIDSPALSSCVACGGSLNAWRWANPQEPSIEDRYLLLRCEGCGSAATAGEPSPELYETGVYAAAPPRAAGWIEAVRRLYEHQKLALLRRSAPPPARLLDAGAGQGRFVLAAQRAGYEASGFEPSARGVEVAAARGVALRRATLEQAGVTSASFDAVALWHVLEHLDDPEAALARIHTWLAPGGVALVGVPNLASLQARIGGMRWIHLDVPRHRHHFTPAGLRALLARTGFEIESEHHLLVEHNLFGMWQAWLDRVTTTPAYAYNLVKRNAPVTARDLIPTIVIAPLAPVAVAVEATAGLIARGGTMAFLARRR